MKESKNYIPCYFYNTGGCYWGDKCKFNHIAIEKPMERPQSLRYPCMFYHLKGSCNNIYCIHGHSELSEKKWKKYFPQFQYPGVLYTLKCNWQGLTVNSWDSPNDEINYKKMRTIIINYIFQK